jgi:16S rRNA (cytosine967-C5)-methyltransferase
MTTAVPVTSRGVAADALVEWEAGTEFADDLLSRYLNQSSLRGSDRALAADLFWGTIRWRGRLDAVIAPAFNGDYSRAQVLIRVLLRLGAYQIYCLDRIPDHAAVSQTVEVAVTHTSKSAAGLVNAILRRLARERERWSIPPEEADEVGRLMFFHSHPRWIVNEYLNLFGQDKAAEALEANNGRSPLTIVINTLQTSDEDVQSFLHSRALHVEPSALLNGYYRLPTSALHALQPLIDQGQIIVQDESAGLAAELLSPEPGERVLDMCAAPGGKLIAMYRKMQGQGEIVAVEADENRFHLLQENLQRTGCTNVEAHHADGTQFKAPQFDKILADVPCSGMGLLRKHPDVRWRRKQHHLTQHHKAQLELLTHAAELVKPGGIIVYSTCSILPSENHEIVNTFLKSFPDFHKEDARGFLPETVVSPHGDMETFTHIHDTDGAYAVRLRRTSGTA